MALNTVLQKMAQRMCFGLCYSHTKAKRIKITILRYKSNLKTNYMQQISSNIIVSFNGTSAMPQSVEKLHRDQLQTERTDLNVEECLSKITT